MAQIFVSYASANRAWVAGFVAALRNEGWSIWWDRQIAPGTSFHHEIDAALREASCVITVWSAASVQSSWVLNESEDGRKRGILVPVLCEPVTLPLAFRHLQAVDLSGWQAGVSHAGYEGLVRHLVGFLPEGSIIRAPQVSGGWVGIRYVPDAEDK
jgi:hypothetical protein